MSSIPLKGHQPYPSPSISAKANVYRAKVKLDPEWFLLVLLGIFMSLSLPSVTLLCGLAMIAAALSATSAHGRHPGKGILLSGKDMYSRCCLAICFTPFQLKDRETQLDVHFLSGTLAGNASSSRLMCV